MAKTCRMCRFVLQILRVFYAKHTCIYLLLLLTATIAGQARNERKELLLNDAWTIRPISDPTPTAKSVAVTLPHTWNATYTKGTHYNRETMVYSRTLAVTPQMAEGFDTFA